MILGENMRINPIGYSQNYTCSKLRNQSNCQKKQQNQNINFGNFFDKRACEGFKKVARGDIEAVVNAGESKFFQVYHGWDDEEHEYVLKTELNEDYFNSKDSKVQKRVKSMIEQAKEYDYVNFERTDLFWQEIANLAYQLRPYEQYDSTYPYVRNDNASYEKTY